MWQDLPDIDCNCLGCLMDAHNHGDLTDEEYDYFYNAMQDQQPTASCPRCGSIAYVSEYEPDMMHCPSCGLYCWRDEEHPGEWVPAMQGVVHP